MKAWKEAARIRRELKRQLKKQQRLQQIEIWGGDHVSPETSAKISQAHKGRIPWNKGFEAWNKNREWPVEVKENISKGMIAYWIQRKEKAAAAAATEVKQKYLNY